MFGLLPPSSSVTRLSARPHLAPISRPTAVEPVKATLSTPGWSTSAAPVSPSPVSTLTRARGEAGLERQLAEPQRRQRRLLGRLQDDRAARGERRGDLPDRHQQREVPGDDLRADADRLAQRVARAGRGPRPGSSRPRSWSASRRSSAGARPRPATSPFAAGERLAVVERLELGELVAVGLDQLGEAVDQPGALRGRDLAQRAPRRRAARRGDGARRRPAAPACATSQIGSPVAGSTVANVRPSAACGRSPPISRPWGERATNSRAASDESCSAVAVGMRLIVVSRPPGRR